MLRSSATHYLRVDKSLGANREGGDASDQDHRNKIQMRLLTLCRRSLACPVGRGNFFFVVNRYYFRNFWHIN